jgi:hypothetical protein
MELNLGRILRKELIKMNARFEKVPSYIREEEIVELTRALTRILSVVRADGFGDEGHFLI